MKILVQSDDYGFTRGVVDGMCDAFERGIITATGLFVNMPIRDYAIERISHYPHICFGIDINVTSGTSVSNKELLPTLVDQETGMFIQTSQRTKDPHWKENIDLYKPYDECFIEACAQIEKFIELVGKKPEYLTSHSTSGSKTYIAAIKDAAHKYEIPFSREVAEKYQIKMLMELPDGDPFSIENQMIDREEVMLRLLEENKEAEYVCLPSHCGFVDHELMKLTRCNISRAYDHAYLVSPKIKQWIAENKAELVSYRDLL